MRPNICTYMEGAVESSNGGGRGSVLARWCEEVRPEPISARAGAAQEVWLGLSRRLIPAAAAAADGAGVEVMVGACVAVSVVGGLDQGRAEMP